MEFVAIAAAIVVAVALGCAHAGAAGPDSEGTTTLPDRICRMVDAAADINRLPAAFLTRVLWQESGFRTDVTSPAGAQGVAQFMPRTAAERGLADPRQPGPAIVESARMLADLNARFGNLGLAAAAYNAGAGRVARWLRHQADLPLETQLYVLAVTGHRVEQWAAAGRGASGGSGDRGPCLAVTADLGHGGVKLPVSTAAPRAQMAAWQIRLDQYLARAVNLQQQPPGTIPPSRSSLAATALCDKIRSMGAACEVYDR